MRVAAAGRIRGTKYPQAEEFAARNVLQPPSEQDMLAAFSGIELSDEIVFSQRCFLAFHSASMRAHSCSAVSPRWFFHRADWIGRM